VGEAAEAAAVAGSSRCFRYSIPAAFSALPLS
jgi:hypothetical protein